MSSPRTLGLKSGIGLVIANMVGAGVFLSTGFMAQSLSPGLILIAWLIGGVLALCGAKAYAEVARLVPGIGLSIDCQIDFETDLIRRQRRAIDLDPETFRVEISRARTFGFAREIEHLRANGLARGGSLDNAIVVGKRSVLNDSLRFEDEFVRHKMLDLVGDLWLLGRPLVGHVTVRNAGHALNHELVAAMTDALASERRQRVARPQASGGLAGRLERLVPGGGMSSQPGIAAL